MKDIFIFIHIWFEWLGRSRPDQFKKWKIDQGQVITYNFIIYFDSSNYPIFSVIFFCLLKILILSISYKYLKISKNGNIDWGYLITRSQESTLMFSFLSFLSYLRMSISMANVEIACKLVNHYCEEAELNRKINR